MIELFFWFSFAFIFFTYIGYPIKLGVLQFFFKNSVHKTHWEEWPEVSVIVSAKNEEKNIHKRITNLVEQDYPKYKLEIIIVSDGSTDGTVRKLQEIERELSSCPVSFETIVKQESSGKPSALNEGVMSAKGSILIFADVRQQFTTTAIKELVANFSDSRIGCVSGELEFIEESNSNLKVEMGAYWKYEKAIRKMESSSASVVGATGAIYAIRKDLYIDLPAKVLLDDVLTPLNVASQGYRVIFDQTAKAYDTVSTNVSNEWTRKVRTLAGNWQLLSYVALLSKTLSFRFLSRYFWHKIARLLIPHCLIVLLISSIFSEGMVYKFFAGLQLTFYLLAIFTHFFSRFRQLSLLKLCYFFCVLNVAAVVGFWVWITGKSGDAWKPTASQGIK